MKDLIAPSWQDYELLDSGKGLKLERFGTVVLIRPEQAAVWEPGLDREEWEARAWGQFHDRDRGKGEWRIHREFPSEWILTYPLEDRKITFFIKPTQYKHLGVFPEQSINWEYLYGQGQQGERVLNLFAYTGGATQAAALAGCETTHIDSVYPMVGWARENGIAAGLTDVRWICEDSMTYVDRELKRSRTYHRIIMDPPTYGFSKKGGQWKIERDLAILLTKCRSLLVSGGEIILNCYSVRMEEDRLLPLLGKCFPKDRVSCDRLFLKDNFEHLLSCGYLARIDI
ncbi:MAG: class I SAM-dependent methyltransferase [Spirochaetales bacterium]|nr:class I SAM-dependent methyltransferase [Spirochaetales bacterium]